MIKRDILLLSLGTGTQKVTKEKDKGSLSKPISSEADLRDTIMTESLSYRRTYYKVSDNEKPIESAFVAEVLIKEVKPNIVYILGTEKSSWISFYLNFMSKVLSKEEQFNDVLPVFKMQNQAKGKTDLKTLDKEQKFVQELYSKKLVKVIKDKYSIPNLEIIVLFLPNGSDLQERKNIYSRLSNSLEHTLINDEKNYIGNQIEYDISFDITHSFRSMPFYNYAVVSYFKQVTSHRINLKNIYYGMIDAKIKSNEPEIGLVAPVVNLSDINELLDLNNAVYEFRESGNVKSLLRYLDQQKETNDGQNISDLIDVLKKFDWAMGSNDATAVYNAISDINDVVSTSYSRTKDSDIKRAIKSALAIPITDWGSLKDIRYLNIDDFKFADNQLLLSKWYFNQHRYSQAICTATECFRSYTTVIYSPLKYKIQNDQQKFDRIIDEDFRRIAIQKFIDNNQLLNNIEKNIPKVGRLCKDISEYYKNKAVKVRNVCAHNLMTNENNISENGIEIIGHFLDLLENFRNCLNNNYNMKVIRMAYTTKLSSNGKPKCLFIYDKKIDSNILQKKVDTLYIKNEKVVALQDGILSDINEKEKFCLELNYIIQQESAMEDEPNQFRVVFDSSIKQEIVINTVLLQKNNLNCTIFQMGNTEPFSYFMQEYSLYFDNDTESIKFIPINYAFTKLTRSNPETSNNEKTITDKNQYIKQGNKTAKQNEKKDLTPSYPQYCSVETIKKLVNKLNIKIITESDTKNAIDFDELERFEFINSLENYAIKYDSVNKINMDFRCDFKTYTVLNYDNINNIKTLKEICVKKPDYTIVVSESDETSMEQILKILALHKILRDPLKKFSPDKIKTMSERFKKAIKKCSEI